LDKYYQEKVGLKLDNLEVLDTESELKLNKNLSRKIEEILEDGLHQLDFIVLFYISFFDLSIQFEDYLESENINIDIDKVMDNCENLLSNPVIIKSGLFAFLELLDKLFEKLNLDSKNVKIMDIQNINNLHSINGILDSLDGEIVEK